MLIVWFVMGGADGAEVGAASFSKPSFPEDSLNRIIWMFFWTNVREGSKPPGVPVLRAPTLIN